MDRRQSPPYRKSRQKKEKADVPATSIFHDVAPIQAGISRMRNALINHSAIGLQAKSTEPGLAGI